MNLTRKLLLAGTSVAVLAALLFARNSNDLRPTSNRDLARVSVMITNLAGNSGGSGVILSSGPSGSAVLTNKHVCGLAHAGARLTTSTKTALVSSFKTSELHDLCLINTKSDLGVSTQVAMAPPSPEDSAIVSGFPNLFPHIVTRGHFTQKTTVSVMTGIRPCTEEEAAGDLQMVCLFLGGIPVIKIYDSQIVTNLIMAGSSGSPVFNEAGQISGLIFAGSQGLSFGFIVPWEYVRNFVDNEAAELPEQFPNMELDIKAMMSGSRTRANTEKLLEHCKNENLPEAVLSVCRSLGRSIVLGY